MCRGDAPCSSQMLCGGEDGRQSKGVGLRCAGREMER
jgi:hypothetical protein